MISSQRHVAEIEKKKSSGEKEDYALLLMFKLVGLAMAIAAI